MAPLIRRNVQICPDNLFSIKTCEENLFVESFSHVHHLGKESELVAAWILAPDEDLHSLVSDLLPHESPVIFICFFGGDRFIHVQSKDLLTDSDQLLDVFLEPSHDHAEVISLDIATATTTFIVRFSVI